MVGKSGFEKLFPHHFAGPWGGNRGLFPPHSADPGWEIEVISHPYAGKSGPPQAEILRIWGFEILDFLYKNVFWGPKILKKSACGGLFACLVSFTKCISETKTLQNFRLRRADRFVIFVNARLNHAVYPSVLCCRLASVSNNCHRPNCQAGVIFYPMMGKAEIWSLIGLLHLKYRNCKCEV